MQSCWVTSEEEEQSSAVPGTMQSGDQSAGARPKNRALLPTPAAGEAAGDDREAPRHEQKSSLKRSWDSVEFPEPSQPSSSGLQVRVPPDIAFVRKLGDEEPRIVAHKVYAPARDVQEQEPAFSS